MTTTSLLQAPIETALLEGAATAAAGLAVLGVAWALWQMFRSPRADEVPPAPPQPAPSERARRRGAILQAVVREITRRDQALAPFGTELDCPARSRVREIERLATTAYSSCESGDDLETMATGVKIAARAVDLVHELLGEEHSPPANGHDLEKKAPAARLTPARFRDEGFLFYVNRVALHPLGLALTVQPDPVCGELRFGDVLDVRRDPEGCLFVNVPKADADRQREIERELAARTPQRSELLGYGIVQAPEATMRADGRNACTEIEDISDYEDGEDAGA